MSKKRRSRSAMPESAEEATRMTREELESEIARCLWGYENGGTSQGRKAYFKRLTWYEGQREVLFGVVAPHRYFS